MSMEFQTNPKNKIGVCWDLLNLVFANYLVYPFYFEETSLGLVSLATIGHLSNEHFTGHLAAKASIAGIL